MITLENLDNFTSSEIIDYVSDKLVKQGTKSIDSEGRCVYRGENDCKCAIGHLLSDSEYDKLSEIETPVGLMIKGVRPGLEGKGARFIFTHTQTKHDSLLFEEIQEVHDNHPIEEWEKEFKALKARYEQ